MKHNKQTIEKNIKNLEEAVKMEATILEVVQAMRHYKQVNAKFIDAIQAKGYNAYISKDKHSTKLCIYPKLTSYDEREEFTIYVSEWSGRCPITWDKIESELVRYGYQKRLSEAFEQLKYFELEKVKFKELCDFIDKMEFKCFNLYTVKRELREMLEYANKEA